MNPSTERLSLNVTYTQFKTIHFNYLAARTQTHAIKNQNESTLWVTLMLFKKNKEGKNTDTCLMKQWGEHSGQKKRLNHYFESCSTEEFINVLLSE